MNDLRAHFRPEFLNRLDEIIMFRPLTKENIRAIIDLLAADVNRRLVEKELRIELTEKAKDLLWKAAMIPCTRKASEKVSAEKCGDPCGETDPGRKCRPGRHDSDRRC